MKFSRTLLTTLGGCAATAAAASTFSPARPPAIPLAVRSPYLSTWLQAGSDGGNGGYLPGEWATFWAGQVTAWTGMITVDGLSYIWMGAPAVSAALATQVAFNYTSTRSTFTLTAGRVGMVVEFLSPVTPDDDMRSSLTASYMNVQVYSLDGQAHDVQVYTDISAEWLSGNRNDVVQWKQGSVASPKASKHKRAAEPAEAPAADSTNEYTTYATRTDFTATAKPPPDTTTTFTPYSPTSYPYLTYPPFAVGKVTKTKTKTKAPKPTGTPKVLYHKIYRQAQSFPDENSDQALWGNWYYATANGPGVTYQAGEDIVARANFLNNGSLPDTVDPYPRAINVAWPCFAYAVDFGSVTQPVSQLWTMNVMQTEAIAYENGLINKNVTLSGLWTNYFKNDLAAVSFFYNDYATSSALSTQLDNMVYNDAVAASGPNYAAIVSLAVRQAFGALVLAANGTANDYYVFLKEISSDGNIQTVDVIFPLHPILIYMNPQWLKLLLEPIFVNSEAGYWPFAFTIHDLGQHFPVALGNNDGLDEQQPLEECGNMLIMALAYAQRANDNAWLASHYSILRQWTQFLIQEALIPQNQISTDDFAGALANQTNLAIKGIIGIGAMASIANRTGNTQDGINFTQIAKSYVSQWQTLGIDYSNASYPHTTLSYGNKGTYSLLYNLFGDKELNLGLVPQSVYTYQSNFYPTVMDQFGVPLDTRHVYTKMDWQTWCAAIAMNSTQSMFYSKIFNWISQTPTNHAMGDLWDATDGNYPGFDFIARPVVGGLFAQLALNSAPKTPAIQ